MYIRKTIIWIILKHEPKLMSLVPKIKSVVKYNNNYYNLPKTFKKLLEIGINLQVPAK